MKVVKLQLNDKDKIEDIASECDSFYCDIHIADEHILAWSKEFNNLPIKEVSLIEEMAELTQALSKYYRDYSNPTKREECEKKITEEMAHVLISLKGFAWATAITPENIQKEIEKKWPAAYTKSNGQCPEKCEWTSEHGCLDGSVYQCHCSRVAHTTVDIDTCKYCRFFVEREKEE